MTYLWGTTLKPMAVVFLPHACRVPATSFLPVLHQGSKTLSFGSHLRVVTRVPTMEAAELELGLDLPSSAAQTGCTLRVSPVLPSSLFCSCPSSCFHNTAAVSLFARD